MKCPTCGGDAQKVIYAGIPAKLCGAEECSTLFGWGSWLIGVLPFTGVFMAYSGGYLPALWHWLTGDTQP
jgi:hypothetical protein